MDVFLADDDVADLAEYRVDAIEVLDARLGQFLGGDVPAGANRLDRPPPAVVRDQPACLDELHATIREQHPMVDGGRRAALE